MADITPLPGSELYHACDPAQLDIDSTDGVEAHDWILGQERAIDALDFGLGIDSYGYNIIALGAPGTGRTTTVQRVLERVAATRPVPDDWCYVSNFQDAHKPRALRLPPGRGARLRADMDRLIDDLTSALPSAFETEDYQASVEKLEGEFESRRDEALNELAELAQQRNIQLLHTPSGFAFAPVDEHGEVIRPDAFQALSDTRKQEIQDAVEDLQKRLQQLIRRQFPQWQKEAREKRRDLDREIARYTVGHMIDQLREGYSDLPAVCAWLDEADGDVVDNVKSILAQQQAGAEGLLQQRNLLDRYRVNLLVDNGQAEAAPIVHQDLPNHANLGGRVEYRAEMGTLVTDFTLIKAGDLHRANGGYLVLDLRRVLMQPFAWHSLQRALRSRELRVESLERIYGLLNTVTLDPEPIPLDIKVVLIGDRRLYYLLHAYDPEFREQFKVCADFETDVARHNSHLHEYTRLLRRIIQEHGLMPFAADAVARVIEHSTRLAGDRDKLSVHLRSITELVCEANHWAQQRQREAVAREDVQQAIDKQEYRADRIRSRIYEAISRDVIRIATDGERVGQINGLSVLSLGNFAFGQPSRITARTRLGDGKVIDIERETELGGSLHSKGVMILSSYLNSSYAHELPLSMSASLVFEQSYGIVDGDSASLAELCALLSALAELPIRQQYAVTGSVNQLGEVQAIGGVNEKIEGFFDVCRERGLTGRQGVLIPTSNVRHLMLRRDVVAAAERGEFSIYPIGHVDEAFGLLTGVMAGRRGEDGQFPEGSGNARVERRLRELALQRRAFARHRDDDNKPGAGDVQP